MKFLLASASAALALLSASPAQTHPLAAAHRFTRGVPTEHATFTGRPELYQSTVIPADQQRGVPLNATGNNAALFGNAPEAQLPWFCRIQRTQRYHLAADAAGNLNYAAIDNPIAVFGELSGGTPLYSNRDYRFGAFAGFRDYTDALNLRRGIFRIRAYLASGLANGQINVAHSDEVTFELPWPGDANWNQFLADGARKTVDFHGLKTTVEIVGGAIEEGDPEQWRTWNDPFVITHRASTADYYFVVEYQGWTAVGPAYPMVTNSFPASISTVGFSPLYALDFTGQQPWRSTFLHAPQFEGEPVPSWYYGKSMQELQGAWSFSPSTPPVTMQTAKTVDHSPELRSHPALDEFVTSMGADPIALANYVFNEIELADPVSYNEDGGLDEASINCGGLNRGALATFLEKQGNPWEQCALLVYFLRKSNIAAVYCEPDKDKLGMLDTQLSHLLRMQIKGAHTPDGSTQLPTIVPTNYPWVSAFIQSENRWVHLFPWIKDTEVIEGGNLYDQFPEGTKTGASWVRKYLQADSTIVPEQVSVYQQDSGSDGLVVIEAEGFHEHFPKGEKRWEPYDGTGPAGYSGTWMRAMPNTGTIVSAANFSTQSPRLDYSVDFNRAGTHYIQVRAQDDNDPGNPGAHVGLNGQAASLPTNDFGSGFNWDGTVLRVNVPSVGRHTINLWMGADGARVDKLIVTSNSAYLPIAWNAAGPAATKQLSVEPNVPSNLFPRYARAQLAASNTSFDDLGMRFRDRRHYRTTWDDFPKPFNLYSGNHQFFENLADRANTFDTVRVQLWSDRRSGSNRSNPPDGVYTAGVDGPHLDTGDWLATDLHNRRFYTACRKTGEDAHQLRLCLGPYRSTAAGTGNFAGSDKVQDQLLTAALGASDDNLQFEITRRQNKRASRFGVATIQLSSGGTGYGNEPTVTIAAPPTGVGHRQARGTAYVSGGQVYKVVLTDPGYGYTTAPAMTFTPNGGGSGAAATTVLQDGVRWVHPLGVSVAQISTQKPTIRKGELAAICLNFGSVTEAMLRAHAEDFWGLERSLQATPSLKDDADFQEKMQSTSAYLMGLSYYNRISRWKETNERLHKTRVFSVYAAGLSKLAPHRDPTLAFASPTFGLPNSGDIIPRQATVDMFFLTAAYASNASVHPASGLPLRESFKDFWQLMIAEISAQEHAIINDYYKESAAISTVKLLHRAKALPAGVLRLTKANHVGFGNTNYGTKTLSAWDPSMWSSITAAFTGAGGDYAEVFVTPGPVASASAAYTGLGAMVFSNDQYSALISGNMGLTNGGSGSLFSAPYYSAPSLPNVSLKSTSHNYSISMTPAISPSNPVVAPASPSPWNFASTASNLTSGSFLTSTSQAASLTTSASLLGLNLNNDYGSYYAQSVSRGSTGSPSFFGAVNSALSTFGGWVSDPVSAITGEFYIDATDLALAGPMPIEIRRNYSSSALSDNEFGHGWKLAYFPYLVVGDVAGGSQLIYGAEMDGSVIAYRRDTTEVNLFVPTTADNPSLRNLHNGGAGSTGNVLNNRIVKATVGADTIYTLTGPNGQTRRFKVEAFAVGTITRSRPYLDTWKDANGNTLTFQYERNSSDIEYGLLKRVGANNGNFIGFDYDANGHIVEAYTGDGRRVKYSYDAQGDLRTVTLPDGAVHAYDYEQETTSAGGESLQTSKHLLVRETKPGGRILENEYYPDNLRRVKYQRAVVDSSTPNPVRNAEFIYSTATANADKTWTGNTIVKDAYGRQTRFDYVSSLMTGEDDPETPAEVREWYLPGDNSVGAYPRSLKQITDRRGVVTFFKYDTRGNLVEKSVGTDLNPADLDGDGVASAGEKAVTSWTYSTAAPWDRVTTQTEPSAVITKWFYEDGDYPYLPTRVEKHAGGQLVSKTVRTFYEKLGTPSAYGLLLNERVAADSTDEAKVDWEHSSKGFPTKRTSLTGTPTDPAVVVDLVHNLRGELIEEKDALNRQWKYNYDAMGRRIWAERRDAANNLLSWDYTYYNLNGEVEWADGPRYDPEDYTWARHDGHGRRTEEIRWRSKANNTGTGVEAGVGDQLTSTTFFRFDKFNNLEEVRTPRRHSVWMEYDQIGRMTGRRYFEGYASGYGQGGSKATERFTYEPGGEVWTHASVLGGTTTMLYNARGRVRNRMNADASVEDWRYFPDGRIYREYLRHPAGTLGSYWETTYDDLNRIVTRRLKNSGGTTLKTQIKGYDRRGNCISETADGFTFAKTYDDLNRIKTITGPGATATSAQQVTTYNYPDGAGREEQVANALGEKTITLRDALGRLESMEVRAADNGLVRKTSYVYSADHSKVTTTEGTGAGAIVTETWTDTFGKTALTRKADGSAEFFFYDQGGLVSDHFDRALRHTNYVRNWRGDVVTETRPGGVVVGYLPDAAGNILQRNMPGGLSEQAQYDTAGRQQWSKLMQGVSTTRLVNYAYRPPFHPWVGLLYAATDPRGIVTRTTYDEALRVATVSSTGPDAEDAVSRTLGYNERDQLTSLAETGFNGTTQVTRSIDGYGAIVSEQISIDSVQQSGLVQSFDATGRRTQLTGAGPTRAFAYDAAGAMTGTTVNGQSYLASFGTNGLLTTRSNPYRVVTVSGRDVLGRPIDRRTTVSGALALYEYAPTVIDHRGFVPPWNGIDKLNNLSSTRSGLGGGSDNRYYEYDFSGRLVSEKSMPRPSANEEERFYYDGGSYATTGFVGVRTSAQRVSDSVFLQQVPAVADFARVLSEQVGGSLPRSVALSGNAFGAGTVKLTLDGRNIAPVSFPGWQDPLGNWSASALLAPGTHSLVATATHPSGWVAPAATSSFQVQPRAETVTNTYDEVGNVAARTWSGGKTQTLKWDGRGRLLEVVQTGVSPFVWKALHDGLNRRLRTTYTPQGSSPVSARSTFDPEVEFLELGLSINGQNAWKIYGPDLSERYGGLQGVGGLEAIIGADGVTRGIVNDWFGNTIGDVAAPGAAVTWKSAHILAWGASATWSTPPLDGLKPLHELLGYRGLTVDPPGFIQQGLRSYDPVAGRWLSPDPLGHNGSLSLYDYCDNDPVNVFDPDGRFGKDVLPEIGANFTNIGIGMQNAKDQFSDFAMTLATDPGKIGTGLYNTGQAVANYYGNFNGSDYLSDLSTGLSSVAENFNTREKAFQGAGGLIFNVATAAVGGEFTTGASRSFTAFTSKIDDLVPIGPVQNGGLISNGPGAAARLRYVGADYHGTVKVGGKNPAPISGQEALDMSLQVKPTAPRRVGVDPGSGNFTVLDETGKGSGVYHGHTRSWNELEQPMKNTLIEAGIVDRKGNILTD